ncbi:MAG: hypothetical protein LBQ58_05110 [Synergistaceae bacterium]|jgi:hypothetical protein|nr:hypothetical protein [Synergistaceae bacterium]
MLFLWTITKHGKIWLDGDAFRQIVMRRLPADFYCQEVSFDGDQNLLNIYITLPEKDAPQKRLALMDKFEEFFRPTGIAVHVHWTRRPHDEFQGKLPLWRRPLTWAIAAGGVASVANLGIRGLAWVIGSTFFGYVVAWLALSEDGNKLISKLISDLKDFRR